VAQALNNDSELGATSPSLLIPKLLLAPLESLNPHPPRQSVLVIDALDECGDEFSRRFILTQLLEVTARAPWLKVIVTSRPEDDIQSFFLSQEASCSIIVRDLVRVQASTDIRHFLSEKFGSVATRCNLHNWPGDKILDNITNRSDGLFIYADTIYQFVKDDFDPKHALGRILAETPGDASKGLDKLYLQAITLVTGNNEDKASKVKRVVGAIIAVTHYRALKDETLACLLNVEPYIVKIIADKLSSLFYRDIISGALRARHLSIFDFFVNPNTPDRHRIRLNVANTELGIGCLRTMNEELRFNMCQLETSSLMNSDVVDLNIRIHTYISDALQYSCVYFSEHLSSGVDPSSDVKGQLNTFLGCERALFWMEAISLLGEAPAATASLRTLRAWLKVTRCIFLLVIH
jgi:hypothetical protein